MGKKQALVYGRRAALAVAKNRPDDIERVLYQEGMPNRDLAPLLKACAQRRRPYRAVSATELERASKSDHHEGVLVVTRLRKPIDFPDYLSRWSEHQSVSHKGAHSSASSHPSHKRHRQTPHKRLPIWVALDRVDNDHNRGAIARSLAWFGGEGLIWEGRRPQLSGAALRIAQGAAEDIELLAVSSMLAALDELRARGVIVLGADQHEGQRSRSALSQPTHDVQRGICWVMGSERFGLSEPVKSRCDALVMIPGSGQVESLNVSVSAGILITQSYHWLSELGTDKLGSGDTR